MRFLRLALVAAVLLVGLASIAVADQGPRVFSGPGAQFAGYSTPVMVVQRTGTLEYTNLDLVQHDVVHDVRADGIASKKKRPWCSRFPRGQCPLFWSARAGLGSTVTVKGLSGLKPGQVYTFYCTLHPGMKGRLVTAP
jgi:plastocyanin